MSSARTSLLRPDRSGSFKKFLEMAAPSAEELLEFLIDSARYGDTEDVVAAIVQGVAVDGVDESGRTGGRAGFASWMLDVGHGAGVGAEVQAATMHSIKGAGIPTPGRLFDMSSNRVSAVPGMDLWAARSGQSSSSRRSAHRGKQTFDLPNQ